MSKYIIFLLCFLQFPSLIFAQGWTLKGNVKNEKGQNLETVQIQVLGTGIESFTDGDGNYEITISEKKRTVIRFSLLGYEYEILTIANPKDSEEHKIIMQSFYTTFEQVDVRGERRREEIGTIEIGLDQVQKLPSAAGGVEGLLKILVGSNNELTSQYSVRGGNFDENLVYVNDFEIYRPFLVRSGQQEGLSFVNPDLVSRLYFSVGGFQAKYGDKQASVLDVQYKKPTTFGGSVDLSLLGANAHLEGASKNGKIRYLLGARHKANQYLLQSQPIKGNYQPSFTDIQALLSMQLHKNLDMEIIGNYARNRFSFEPQSSSEAFGLVNKVLRLRTDYKGQEEDAFDTRFLGAKWSHYLKDNLTLKWNFSLFQSKEYERYDIRGLYGLYEVESDLSKKEFGQDKLALGTAALHKFARNELNSHVLQIGHMGNADLSNHFLQWGLNFKSIGINDFLNEWQRRDSAGFSQPFHPEDIILESHVKAEHELTYETFDAFIQDNILFEGMNKMNLNLGLRTHVNSRNKEWLFSPRAQWSIAPNWEKDMMFKLAAGVYMQPAFYREMRAPDGSLNTDLKAQKSWQIIAGFDYHFQALAQRPFKVSAEVFYKDLWDLIPYEYDDVRIRYLAKNNGKGYAYGGELRLFGDLVKDAESWLSIGYLKTEEQLYDENIKEWTPRKPRPTDQRMSFGLFFSDYLPRYKNFKVYLNLLYVTGLPTHPAGKIMEAANYSMRLPDYKRVDIGFAALLLDGKKEHNFPVWKHFKNIWLTAEVLNLLGIENTLSYQWIQDFTTNNIYAVPNRLSNRLINVKLSVAF